MAQSSILQFVVSKEDMATVAPEIPAVQVLGRKVRHGPVQEGVADPRMVVVVGLGNAPNQTLTSDLAVAEGMQNMAATEVEVGGGPRASHMAK